MASPVTRPTKHPDVARLGHKGSARSPCHDGAVTAPDRRPTPRERVRAEVTAEILDAAHRQLADGGATHISLRAVARELGMASSAVHRYFPTRDDVLTALLLREYTALADALTEAEAAVPRGDHRGRITALFLAERRWALEHPYSWGLLFGQPVPGYAAPQATTEPATRFFRLLAQVSDDAPTPAAPPPEVFSVPAQTLPKATALAPDVPEWRLTVAMAAGAWMFGSISAELWGHFGSGNDLEALYRSGVDHWARLLLG